MNRDKKLTVDDIKKLIKEESGIGDIPNINIFGINVNLDTLKTSLCFGFASPNVEFIKRDKRVLGNLAFTNYNDYIINVIKLKKIKNKKIKLIK
jgi:hypothetical protein